MKTIEKFPVKEINFSHIIIIIHTIAIIIIITVIVITLLSLTSVFRASFVKYDY